MEEQTFVPRYILRPLMELPGIANVTLDAESSSSVSLVRHLPEIWVEAHYQASLKMAQDPDGGPYPALPQRHFGSGFSSTAHLVEVILPVIRQRMGGQEIDDRIRSQFHTSTQQEKLLELCMTTTDWVDNSLLD